METLSSPIFGLWSSLKTISERHSALGGDAFMHSELSFLDFGISLWIKGGMLDN